MVDKSTSSRIPGTPPLICKMQSKSAALWASDDGAQGASSRRSRVTLDKAATGLIHEYASANAICSFSTSRASKALFVCRLSHWGRRNSDPVLLQCVDVTTGVRWNLQRNLLMARPISLGFKYCMLMIVKKCCAESTKSIDMISGVWHYEMVAAP